MARWTEVLNAFLRREEWGVRDLAASVGLPRSAVHRILHEMARLDMLAPTRRPGHFRVGPLLVRMSLIVSARVDVTHIARPILERVAAASGETVILCLYAPGRRQFFAADAAESAHPVRYIWESLRDWGDVHVGSTGKGILAFLPAEEQEAILVALPDPVPGLRPMPVAQLRHELAEARVRGYVVSRGERFQGAVGASAPIRDAAGRVIGDLVISWPDNRTSAQRERDLGEVARRAAADVSRGLGFEESPGAP
ncbi:MAG: IclR family transcriptional regulator [Chloroflexi bacterium]|nr:IclR family transcriptional regulator [Chloroflexota bacterium]